MEIWQANASRFSSIFLDTYRLSKEWYETVSIALRHWDIKDLTSKCKSWCYQDLLLKPSEVTLFREVQQGGLGLYHIQSRAMANLITTFLQTAANARFNQSLMHSHLYRYHVLEEHHLPCPGYTPYYGEQFFLYQESQEWHTFEPSVYEPKRDILMMREGRNYGAMQCRNH